MTLDEAIKHAEEVAEEQEKMAKEWHENQVRKCELIPFAEMDYTNENKCKKCADEHRHLAEWLTELKQWREKDVPDTNVGDMISRQAAIDAVCMEWCGVKHQDCKHPFDAEKDDYYQCDGCATALQILPGLPSAEPERETAKFIRWMECKETAKYISYTPHCKCSKCGTEFIINTIKYCYMCGARMEETDE